MLTLSSKNKGFSMIEVLVSLIVIGVGMLGLTGLQIASMKGTNNAHARNVATMLAMDLSERMRANPIGVDAGFYENHSTTENAVDCDTETSQCLSNTYCSPAEIAQLDIQEIMCGVLIDESSREGGVKNQLLAGNLEISCVGGCNQPDVEHEILITWEASHTHEDQPNSSLQKEIRLNIAP